MSRTFRRKHGDQYQKKWYISDYRRVEGTRYYERIYYPGDSVKYKAGLARYHSDAGATRLKEPGPSWFRNMFTERPQRRFNDRELQKFMTRTEYEPMIIAKDRLVYWT